MRGILCAAAMSAPAVAVRRLEHFMSELAQQRIVHATRDLIAAITHPSQAATTCQEDADVDPSSAPAPPRDSAEPPAPE